MGLLTDGYFSLAQDVNKIKDESIEVKEGVISPFQDELSLELDDEELLKLKNTWEERWNNNSEVIILKKRQQENENYWKGKQFDQFDNDTLNTDRPFADNLIFQAIETFLPLVTRQPPEPIVEANNTPDGNKLADAVRKMLIHQSTRINLKMKMQKVARIWNLYLLGAAKVGWDTIENDITVKYVRPQKLILDPNSCVDECKYTGEYVGEYRNEPASSVVKRFPKKAEYIKELVKNKMGTEVQYIEWWTRDYLFYTLEDEVLFKSKNPHWNYESIVPTMDANGMKTEQSQKGLNHFSVSGLPYIFLSVFNLGMHPWEDTNIVQQNLNLQDLINKRQKQIDKNATNTNGTLLVSGDHFTKEQAAQVDDGLSNGYPIWVPQGDVNSAVSRTIGPALPNFIYESLNDYRNELMNMFGVRGATPAGIMNEQTVRGKIIVKGQDADRVSLISENLEQFACEIFNWMVQLFYVYYDDVHTASVIGKERAQEYISLHKNDLKIELTIGVKPGSMIPKDALTRANQAMDLLQSGNLDPITAFEMMEFPNPRETAEKLFIWKSNPMMLFPDLQQQMAPQPQMPPNGGQPGMPPIPGGAPTPNLPPDMGQQPQPPQDILSQVPTQ